MTHPIVKSAGWVQVSQQALADGEAFNAAVNRAIDRWVNPWRYPDPGWPTFDLFPRSSALIARWHRWQNRRALARAAKRGDLDDWDRDAD